MDCLQYRSKCDDITMIYLLFRDRDLSTSRSSNEKLQSQKSDVRTTADKDDEA